MKRNRIIIVMLLILLVFNILLFKETIFYTENDKLEEVNIENFKGIENLKFSGKVIKVKERLGHHHGMGILLVETIQSNIQFYDPRNKQANYYCVIRDTIAEFYVKGVSDIKPNDSIYVNINTKTSKIYNKKRNFIRKLSLMIYPRSFFDYIKRKNHTDI